MWEHLRFRIFDFHDLAVSSPSGMPVAFSPFILSMED